MTSTSHRLPIAIAATVIVLGTFTYLSALPGLRKGPGPVGRRLRKIRVEEPLPEGFKRIFVDGLNGGKLELLTNEKAQDEGKAPLLMVHGGMGSARCYDRWAAYFASKGRNVYSLSLSGHGHSYRPENFNSMTCFDLVHDIDSAAKYIVSAHPASPAPVLTGHSAGGGESQLTVATLPPNTFSGVILLAPFPPTGGLSVYREWLSFDWLLFPRFFWQGADNMSPLSTPALLKRAFFSDTYKEEDLDDFFKQMSSEESAGWAESMTMKFTDSEMVKANVLDRVHIISASNDRLMTPPIMKELVSLYGCSTDTVEGSGHHMMFDDRWYEAAQFAEAKLQAWNL
ncbi:hypothetical protein E1B28_004781 [Marasmius oreades]|uniref:AB hydrolase-1 domain-containing protein n=1 Tax=Marasmius oreades TaxID=181124 RepID=A0A9P8ADB9_9AGAR|nr:uncharacterized protein E1B28_004781 [Marasmius oreades]KAG7097437.1 hypothetical protein E1B28_004781 [Marasmius oreades]